MAAAAQDASEDDRSRRRKLPVIEGRLNISEGENLRNFIKTVPSGHYHAELTYLVLSAVSLQQIPKDICTLPNLTRLDCSENKLTTIPPEISKLVSLTHLDISKNQISNVPLCMLTMTALCTLSIKDNLLTELPQLNVLPNLAALKANRNHLHLGRLPPGLTTIMKSFGAQHVPSEIEPGLYLGSYISAQNLTVLQALHITHILTVARETPPAFPDKFEYRHIKEDDLPSVDLSKYFDEMAEYIARGKAAGGILVHCRQGISRSATAVAAYLIKKRGISYDGALDWLRTARQCVNPNSGFRKQLRNLYRECRRLRTPLLPGAPEAPVPEPIAEGDEESEQKEAKEVPEAKEKRDKKEKKERRSSREVKSEQVATETTAAAAQAPTGPVVVPELDIAADPRKKRSEERGSKIDRKDKEEREKKEKKEKEKKEKKDKERKHKSGSQIDRKDRESTKDAKAPQPKADASVPPPTDFATSRSVEMSVDAPPPPRAPLAAEAAPQASLEGAMVLRKAIEEEVRAAFRTELEAQVRREAELKLTEELMRREAVLRATIEAEIREQLAREMRPAHTALEMPSPTDTENDPLLAKPKEEEGVCSWCSIV